MKRLNHNLLLLKINKFSILIYFSIFFSLSSCSFDHKTGIWKGSDDEKRKISEIEKNQKQTLSVDKIHTSDADYVKEVSLAQKIVLSAPQKNKSWKMSELNYQNSIGNVYLANVDNIFLKKKIGKNKFYISKLMSSPLIYKDNIIFSDDRGTLFNINQRGKINWKKNIYSKIFKKIYKNLTFTIYKCKVYISDNIGFIYALNLDDGELIWVKNHGIPLKSKIKVFDDKIFLINQDNRLISLNVKDGSKVWDIRTISSFIKTQNFLSLAISEEGHVVALNSSGDLLKAKAKNGTVLWSLNALRSSFAHATDFFTSSGVVIHDDDVFFSAGKSILSVSLKNGTINWQQEANSVATPIVDEKNIFAVTDNGFFLILDRDTGNIISSSNILKSLKKKKQLTKITGFIMGSGKIYSVTSNGYLIVSSAISGRAEYSRKIGDTITSSPVINEGKLYILTEDSRIIGFN